MSYQVICIAPKGLGYGKGKISTKVQVESGELSPEALRIGADIITNDQDVFRAVDRDAMDDGCGDGRPALHVFQRDTETGEEIEFKKSRCRSKLFGGGLIVAASMWRTIMERNGQTGTVLSDRKLMAEKLDQKGIEYGTHTDDHAEGDSCGCGAIDNYQSITMSVVSFKKEIDETLRVLYGDTYADNESAIRTVFAAYEQLAKSEGYFSDDSGVQTMNLLIEHGALAKELTGGHKEDFIVLNNIEGTTFDQRKFDDKLRSNNVDSAQAFVVDVWRGLMYANVVAEIASEAEGSGVADEYRKIAYADFLIRTLAVSGTLTAGDLPVFVRKDVNQDSFVIAV